MSTPAIQVQQLGKQYRVGLYRRGYKTMRDQIGSLFRFRKPAASASRALPERYFWAVKDVSFSIAEGEVVGVIGRNGAGKSTLLKLLSRITAPTEGRIEVCGRIGSLLEVGTGFHPELTGRENIFMSGAILGMTKAEISRKFDAIVEFAEVERFVDTAVKHYSSGMYLRLAFAVAAHLEPEILIVDEVLAVGDAVFQKKCLGKMKDVSRTGRTVLFVSHNMTAVRSLCSRAIWLDRGQVRMDGDSQDTVSSYLKDSSARETELAWDDPASAPGNDDVRLNRISVVATDGSDHISVATPLALEVRYWNLGVTSGALNVSIEVYNTEDICVFSSFSKPAVFPRALLSARCMIPPNLLNDAAYRFRVMLVRNANTILLSHDGPTVEISDIEREVAYYGKWLGALRPKLHWSTAVVAEDDLMMVEPSMTGDRR